MVCTLQIFLDDHWEDCAQIELHDGLYQWNYLVPYVVEHTAPPLSLCEPVDTKIRAARTMPAFLYDLVPQGKAVAFYWENLICRTAQTLIFRCFALERVTRSVESELPKRVDTLKLTWQSVRPRVICQV